MTDPIQPKDAITVGASAPARPRVDPRLEQAAEEFASLLWEEVLHTALPTDTLMGDASGADVYGGLVESGLAGAMGKSGAGGLARMLIESLSRGTGGADAHPPKGPESSSDK
ncbi:MAG TPA: rod-binding protein [bacterium]|nr:rod-binding protein [bacterium]